MSATTEGISFFGLSEESIVYDERKKRFFSTKSAPLFLER